MLKCPLCGAEYPNGTLLCEADGYQINKPPEEACALVPPIRNVEILVERFNRGTLCVIVEALCEEEIEMSERKCFSFPLDTAGDPPIRIGRSDISVNPTIHPEIDLVISFGEVAQTFSSRLHAAIERNGDQLFLHAVSLRSGTWIRRTGKPHTSRLHVGEYVILKDYDSIYIGDPKGTNARLRVRIHNPQA